MTAKYVNSTKATAGLTATMREAWSRKENRWAILIAVACAYLSLFNLGYAPLWDDEPHMASIARNLLDSGEYTTWDGRNLMGAQDGSRAVNEDLVAISYPPWQAISTLVGISLFGYNETGVRFFHALLGVASLFLFWRLLRIDFAARPRLRVIAFVLFALSAQTILFFRQGRYCADAIFFSLALIYAYRLYIGPSGKAWHLACATTFAVWGFFNQFFIGITTLMAIAIWHLIFFWRDTTRRQWVSFVVAGAVFSSLCLGYLWGTGIIENRTSLDLGDLYYRYSWPTRSFVITYLNFRDIVKFNWIPVWVAIWLLGLLGWMTLAHLHHSRQSLGQGEKARWWRPTAKPGPEDMALARYLVLGSLMLVAAAFTNVQSTSEHTVANTRYLVATLPFSFLLVAACVDWVWRRFSALPALSLLAALMLSNLVGQPASTRQLRLTLPSLVQEIHQPLRNSMVEVTEYLQAHAKQDELILVEPWQPRDVLMFYLGDKLRFCCMIDKERTPLPPETVLSMGEHLYDGATEPDWLVDFSTLMSFPGNYEQAFTSESNRYSSGHRPELEYREFRVVHSSHTRSSVRIYKKKPGESATP
jgi:4-amino-4-deoxy-L-arabinose transferase-like glycosyltransferase